MRRRSLIALALASSCTTPTEMADTQERLANRPPFLRQFRGRKSHAPRPRPRCGLRVPEAAGQRRACNLEGAADRLVLDTKLLTIERVETSSDGATFSETSFDLGDADPVLGAPLTIALNERTACGCITRPARTQPACSGSNPIRPPARKRRSFSRNRRPSTRARGFPCKTRRPSAPRMRRRYEPQGRPCGDERGDAIRRRPNRRIPLRDAAADTVVSHRLGGRRSGLRTHERTHRHLRRARRSPRPPRRSSKTPRA